MGQLGLFDLEERAEKLTQMGDCNGQVKHDQRAPHQKRTLQKIYTFV